MNTGTPWPSISIEEAEERVLRIQTKLHHWAADDSKRRFYDLYNLVTDPAFLLVAWRRVKGNRGSRTAGVDGETAHYITSVRGEENFLADLRAELKARAFMPLPVKERLIPKPGSTKRRRLGIPSVRDRVVQAALKLVLEPLLEAGFQPSSYGYRPNRQVQDAIAEIHFFASRSYEWVLEGDIMACFDEISHSALLDRMRDRIGDKHVLALVKAFLKSGILTQDGEHKDTITGTPQGGILSPLLSNVALSVLDDHFAEQWGATSPTTVARTGRRRRGLPNFRLVRYADDFVVLISGTRDHAQALYEEAAAVLSSMGLRLSQEKTRISHIDEGFDFLGFRVQRKNKRGSERQFVYTYPSKAALAAIKDKVRTITRKIGTNKPLTVLLRRLNPVLRGWANFFRYGVSKATFGYLWAFAWHRVVRWLRRKHPRITWKKLRSRYLPQWRPTEGSVALFDPASVRVTRYRYRGARIPSPWAERMESVG